MAKKGNDQDSFGLTTIFYTQPDGSESKVVIDRKDPVEEGKIAAELTKAIQGSTPKEESPENLFQKKGDVWTIKYKGKSFGPYKHLKGFLYISQLLGTPGDEIHVSQLEQRILPDQYQDGIRDDGLTVVLKHDDQMVVDDKTIQAINEEIDDLTGRREASRKKGEIEAFEELSAKIHKLEVIKASSVNNKGKARKFSSETEATRKRITKNIKKAIKQTSDPENQSLWNHLYNSITTGEYCSYNPESLVEWKL